MSDVLRSSLDELRGKKKPGIYPTGLQGLGDIYAWGKRFTDSLIKMSDKDIDRLHHNFFVKKYRPIEFKFFEEEDLFRGAQRVLDIGCGPGFFLDALARKYLEKTFVGIDINAEYVEESKARAEDIENVTYEVADMMNFTSEEPFDFIICRGSVQYIQKISEFLAKAPEWMHRRSTIWILERSPAPIYDFSAELPLLTEVTATAIEVTQKKGKNYNVVLDLLEATPNKDLRIVHMEDMVMHFTTEEEKLRFVQGRMIVAEYAKRFHGIDVDSHMLMEELVNWKAAPGSNGRRTVATTLMLRKP